MINSRTPKHISNAISDTPLNINFPDIFKDQQIPPSNCGIEQDIKRFGNRYGSSSVGSGQQLLQDTEQKSITHLPELQDYQKQIQFQMQKRILQCAQNEKQLSLKLQNLQDRSNEMKGQQYQINNYTKFCRSQASERGYENIENLVSSFLAKDEDLDNNLRVLSINRKKECNKKASKKKRRQLLIQ